MGNRGVIRTEKRDLGVYLHWNGGRDSVEAFLKYCELQGFRSPERDSYGFARLCQIIGNFFGGSCSLDIFSFSNTNYSLLDNGTYIIKDWEIIDREYPYEGYIEQNDFDLWEMLEAIDEKQPEHMQLGPLFFKATETPRDEIKVGDKVAIRILDHGKFAPHEVIGYGADRLVNGQNVKGIPYINYWGGDNPETNINNYLLNESYRVL